MQDVRTVRKDAPSPKPRPYTVDALPKSQEDSIKELLERLLDFRKNLQAAGNSLGVWGLCSSV